ncbi:hypothetical protein ACFFX0_24025 [Citricoccus parietis]|uniref:Uncharacterized protein n=1 Tax=Citricoccus parietis TaxID=592307 RepID=A0ABV5G583_9MICC
MSAAQCRPRFHSLEPRSTNSAGSNTTSSTFWAGHRNGIGADPGSSRMPRKCSAMGSVRPAGFASRYSACVAYWSSFRSSLRTIASWPAH